MLNVNNLRKSHLKLMLVFCINLRLMYYNYIPRFQMQNYSTGVDIVILKKIKFNVSFYIDKLLKKQVVRFLKFWSPLEKHSKYVNN